jgi:hypothetical protein
MIRNITSGAGINISNNSFSMPYVNMSNPSAGMLRYNGSSLEVYDGNVWITMLSSMPQVELDSWSMGAITWARDKMAEEQRMQELAAKHPTVADALAAKQKAEEAVRIAMALCDVK